MEKPKSCAVLGCSSPHAVCVTPHEEQATKWPPYLWERYFTMLEKCTYMTAVSLHPTPTSQLDACKRIIDQSDMVLAVYDAASKRSDGVDTAMDYAGALHRQIVLVHPETFAISVQTNILPQLFSRKEKTGESSPVLHIIIPFSPPAR